VKVSPQAYGVECPTCHELVEVDAEGTYRCPYDREQFVVKFY
jgi:endogenous inhibitor of DNA gyrase (YacG/DUF329 family)